MNAFIGKLSWAVGALFLVGLWSGSCKAPPSLDDNQGNGGTPVVPTAGAGGQGGGQGGMGGGTETVVPIKLDGSIGGSIVPEDTAPPPPSDDANCGSATSSTTRQPAEVLLVLDRSGSMNESIADECYCDPKLAGGGISACSDTTNCTTRWSAVTSALASTMSSTADSSWGLKLFSSTGSGCTVNNGVEVAVAANAGTAVQTKIAGTAPGGNTPTAQAIAAATAYLKGLGDPNPKVILLATDGEPNCASTDRNGQNTPNVPGTVTAITEAKDAGFPVYVIGMGPSVGNLDNFASAGGTTNYYPATSSQALADAFASITKLIATCTFTSDQPPPDPENIAVYLNKRLVDKDGADGWSYDAGTKTVTLNGASCKTVMSDDGATVQILFGCPGGPPPPTYIP